MKTKVANNDPVADEMRTMRNTWNALQRFTPATRRRIVTYLNDRLAEQDNGTTANDDSRI